ncbi:MAG TPA: phenylalanine--tRNA ligase beta subunit-related protein [Thermoleophilaceae bacterium]|nr:phenylalanine--tRNA ligase beta subunit-related protein [Thermoleophilaceae bacterium]
MNAVAEGWIAPELAAELPGLGVYWLAVDARPAKTPIAVRRRMRELAGRITGAKVVQARQDSVPWAYRVLWRRLGVDPDIDRTPVEELMAQRLEHGGLPSRGMPADAVVVATLETGVPVVVADAAKLSGSPGLRPALPGESLGGAAGALRPGEIVYADERAPLARLDGEVAADRAVGDDTTAMAVCALAAAAVSQIEIDEALWIAADMLEAAAGSDGSP